ncbi:MAG: Ig-like domain-containing protein, partial [Actinomycetota bacterium]
ATMTVTARDNGGTANAGVDTSPGQVATITVDPVADAPVAEDDDFVTDEDTTLVVSAAQGVLDNDTDADGDPLTVDVGSVTDPPDGAVVVGADGGFVYDPDPDFEGLDTFEYTVLDGTGRSDTATVTIEVSQVEDPPTALDDAYDAVEDTTLVVSAAQGVLDNDSDGDGDPLTVSPTLIDEPDKGVVSVAGDGSFQYTPDPDENGLDSFTYEVDDGTGRSDQATVTLTVAAVNDRPAFVVGPDKTVDEDSGPATFAGWATAIIAGPANESGQSLSFDVTADDPSLFAVQPAVSPTGELTYTPAADANGTSTLSIELVDDGGTAQGGVDTSLTANADLTVRPVNDAPEFVGGGDVTADEDEGTVVQPGWASGFSAGPADESGQSWIFTVDVGTPALFAEQPTVAPDGTLQFRSKPDMNGASSITVRMVDDGGTANGGVDTSPGQVSTITVDPVADDPVADDDAYTTDEDVTLVQGAVGGLLDNDDDVDGDPLTVDTTPITPPSDGALTLFGDGSFDYDPDDDFNGVDTFQYRVHDGTGLDDIGTVTITVDAVNDAPSFAVGSDQVVLEDSGAASVPGWATGISTGPADESGQSVVFSVVADDPSLFSTQPAVSPTGALTFTPADDENGTTSVTISVSDDGVVGRHRVVVGVGDRDRERLIGAGVHP